MTVQNEIFQYLTKINACPNTVEMDCKIREWSNIYTDRHYYYNEILAIAFEEIYNTKFDEYLMYNTDVLNYLSKYIGIINEDVFNIIKQYSIYLVDPDNKKNESIMLRICGFKDEQIMSLDKKYIHVITCLHAKWKIERDIINAMEENVIIESVEANAITINELLSGSNANEYLSVSSKIRNNANEKKLSKLIIKNNSILTEYKVIYKSNNVNTLNDCYIELI